MSDALVSRSSNPCADTLGLLFQPTRSTTTVPQSCKCTSLQKTPLADRSRLKADPSSETRHNGRNRTFADPLCLLSDIRLELLRDPFASALQSRVSSKLENHCTINSVQSRSRCFRVAAFDQHDFEHERTCRIYSRSRAFPPLDRRRRILRLCGYTMKIINFNDPREKLRPSYPPYLAHLVAASPHPLASSLELAVIEAITFSAPGRWVALFPQAIYL